MLSVGKVLILPKGRYDADAVYQTLDLVMHKGTSWIAKKPVVGIEPSEENVEYWQKLVDIGDAIDSGIEEFFGSGDSPLPLTIPSLTLYNSDNTDMRGTLGVDEQGALKFGEDKVYHSNNLTPDLEIYLENYLKTYLDNNLGTRLKELSTPKINIGSYVGAGYLTDMKVLTFDFTPQIVLVSEGNRTCDIMLAVRPRAVGVFFDTMQNIGNTDYNKLTANDVSWGTNSVTFNGFNVLDHNYDYVAIGY